MCRVRKGDKMMRIKNRPNYPTESKIKPNKTYSMCPEKLRYVFENICHACFEVDDAQLRADKMVLETFAAQELDQFALDIKKKKINADVENWEVIHLDGDIGNNRLDNLEYLFFVNDDQMCDRIDNLEEKIENLLKENKQLKTQVNSNKKLKCIENTNKELNKEIKIKEKEINRLWHLLNER
jgi:hypothetical protein